MKPSEERVWQELRQLKMHFRRQAPIGRYVVDFVQHSLGIVVEIDGAVHRLPEVELRDLERESWLKSQGYRVLRFTAEQAEADPCGVVEAILKALPLVGGGSGSRVSPALQEKIRSARTGVSSGSPLETPPSPTLPPLRGKGVV